MKAFVLAAIGFTFIGTLAFCQDECDKKPAQPTTVASATNHESPFACDRLALTPELRKRHFDELGPQMRLLRKSVRELPDGYEFEYACAVRSLTSICAWKEKAVQCGYALPAGKAPNSSSGPIWRNGFPRQAQ